MTHIVNENSGGRVYERGSLSTGGSFKDRREAYLKAQADANAAALAEVSHPDDPNAQEKAERAAMSAVKVNPGDFEKQSREMKARYERQVAEANRRALARK